MEQKDKEAKYLAAKVQEEKIREEKEKQKLRFVTGGGESWLYDLTQGKDSLA